MEANEFYQAAVNQMTVQINYLEKLIGRSLTDDEKDNIHEFFSNLDLNTQSKFEAQVGSLL